MDWNVMSMALSKRKRLLNIVVPYEVPRVVHIVHTFPSCECDEYSVLFLLTLLSAKEITMNRVD